ncbi:tail protein X [Sulfurimonas sp. NWX79]|uniref:tail protein X n=1 Tax=Campylobacterales TaxID=213849 RepID=UPI003204EAC0|nr:tail protein X [Sulfurimonas phage SNW-1]
MNQYRAVDGDRLDIIVFKAYGSIDAVVFDAVLDANEHLLNSSVLKAGDIVYLPEVARSVDEKKTEALWS